jgi:uncharacterized protein (DUF2147 family)
MHKRILLLALLALFALTVSAADVNGKWKANFTTPNGDARESTFDLKADGDKLTGTVAGAQGEPAKIQEGKISGDDISFFVMRNFGGNEVKLEYKGKVSANEIKFTVSFGGGDRTFEMTAKKI